MTHNSQSEPPQTVTTIGQSNPVRSRNYVDENGNPAGGYAHGIGLCVNFQDGPRGKTDGGELRPANGAFVEDLLVAAAERLRFFQSSRFAHPANQEAIDHINEAIRALHVRATDRAARGVLGRNAV
jgi:hypothetical protein